MEKEKVLVRDNKGLFLKMFKKKFKDDFDFHETSFSFNNENATTDFDRFIFVVYEKYEFMEYLKLDKKDSNVLVCLFNKRLYTSLSFFEELNNLILFDDSKTRQQIISELKFHLKNNSKTNRLKESIFPNAPILQTEFQHFYRALFFFI